MLDIALIVGVLVNLVKAGDLVLRPHQQAQVQAFFEDLTLRLESARPIEWLDWLAGASGQTLLVSIGIAEFLAVAALNVLDVSEPGQSSSLTDRRDWMLACAVIAFSIPGLVLTARRYGPPLAAWLVGPRPVRGVVGRAVTLLGLGFLTLAIFMVALFGLISVIEGHLIDVWALDESAIQLSIAGLLVAATGAVLILPLFVWFLVGIQVSGIILWAVLLARVLELVLKVLRAVAWRIVEYNKGAFSAVVLLLTVALGLFKLIGA